MQGRGFLFTAMLDETGKSNQTAKPAPRTPPANTHTHTQCRSALVACVYALTKGKTLKIAVDAVAEARRGVSKGILHNAVFRDCLMKLEVTLLPNGNSIDFSSEREARSAHPRPKENVDPSAIIEKLDSMSVEQLTTTLRNLRIDSGKHSVWFFVRP